VLPDVEVTGVARLCRAASSGPQGRESYGTAQGESRHFDYARYGHESTLVLCVRILDRERERISKCLFGMSEADLMPCEIRSGFRGIELDVHGSLCILHAYC